MISYLPEEVTVDILSRLPVKTIIHCKCVCKKWRNLVNDSYFINLHLSRSPADFMVHHGANTYGATPRILKSTEIEDGLDHLSLHHEPVMNIDLNRYFAAPIPSTELIPISSVNGLIFIWQCAGKVGVNVDNVYVCNPITQKCLTLPRPQYRDLGFGLVYYNFGVNSLTGEYKVLRIIQRGLPPAWRSQLDMEVYTLGTSQWRSLGQVPYRVRGFRGPFLNGYFHWKVSRQDAPESICTFDLDKETFQLLPSPPTEHEGMDESSIYLGVFKGCLCESHFYDSQFTIWVMKQYGVKKSWHKELVITDSVGKVLFQDGSILVVLRRNIEFAYCPKSNKLKDLTLIGFGFTHCPSFIKLQDIDSERVHTC